MTFFANNPLRRITSGLAAASAAIALAFTAAPADQAQATGG